MSIHVSELEAVRDFAGLLMRVRAGEEVVIEADASPIAVLRPAIWPQPRSVEECFAIATLHEQKLGTLATYDADFDRDVRQGIDSRDPWTPPSWD